MRTQTRKEKGVMDIKVDHKKAYDKLKWSFIKETLVLARFTSYLVDITINYITTIKMQVL